MGNPALISGGPGGRFARGENNGDTRKFANKKLNKGAILKRLWRYLGRNRFLLILALLFSVTSSALALYGPKLSGKALDAIELGTGKVDFDTVLSCVVLMILCYLASALLGYFLRLVMLKISRKVTWQMSHDIFENLSALPAGADRSRFSL